MGIERGPKGASLEILAREVVYRGFFRMDRFLLRHSLYQGGMCGPLNRELFERGHAAAALLYDPMRDRVVLLEQFRIGALDMPGGPWLLEIVAGMIEPGEQAEEVVRREAVEEAGAVIGALHFICDFLVSPGGTSERISLYCAEVDSDGLGGIHGLTVEHEDIRVAVVSFEEAWQLLQRGEINSASPIIALQWLERERGRRWQHGRQRSV